MFKKKIESDKVNATLTEFVDRYIKEYFLNVHFEDDGKVTVWVGSRRDAYTSSETTESSDD